MQIRISCDAIINNRICKEKAKWVADWSDRRLTVCNKHKHYAQEAHDGDHDYDQTEIEWMEIIY